MAAVSAAGQTGEVPSFVDRLGERFVVAQPSGALLEFLVFHPGLSSAPFFETEVKARLKRLSNFRHASFARSTRLQRDPIRGNRLTLVAAYAPGRRLSDILVLARRGKLQPPIGAVLALGKQLMTASALLHDYAPDVFHGAIGPERLVVSADGRLVVTEYVLGTAIEQAVAEFGVARLWRECRLGTLADTTLARYGRRLDLLQIGLVTLSLLLGRQLSDNDVPARLPELLDAARETSDEGESVRLADGLRDWLARLLHIDAAAAFKTLVEAQKAFGRILEDETRYRATPEAVEAFLARCEDLGTLAISAPPDSGSIPLATAAEPSEPTTHDAVAAEPPASQPPASQPSASDVAIGPSEAAIDPIEAASVGGPAADASAHAASCPTGMPPLAEPEVVAAEPTRAAASAGHLPAGSVSERFSASQPATDDAIADMIAALPKPLETGSTVDPFEPFPWAVGTDEKPAPARGEANIGVRVAPAAIDEPRVVPAPPAVSFDAPEVIDEPRTWRSPSAPPPAPAQPEGKAVEANDVDVSPPVEAKTSEHAASGAGDRRPGVLSYDEIHRSSAPRRSKARFAWAAAVVIILAVAGLVGGPKIGALWKNSGKPSAAARPPAGPTKPGGFKITTQPPASRITIDGTPRGAAPLLVDDLAPGLHSIVVESDWGRLEEAVTVEAGRVVPLTLATVGWIRVEAPVELEVSEEGRRYGVTGQALMVPAGRHAFIFSNRSVAVRLRQFVQVPAGQTVKVALDLPKGMLNLTSDQPAQVLLDGEAIGDTPQVSVPAALGPHEVVFRSTRYGDVSYSVNVTLAAPVSLTASFGARR